MRLQALRRSARSAERRGPASRAEPTSGRMNGWSTSFTSAIRRTQARSTAPGGTSSPTTARQPSPPTRRLPGRRRRPPPVLRPAQPTAGRPGHRDQGHAGSAPPSSQPAPAADAGVADPAARRRRADRGQHGGQPRGADRDLGARCPGQAADRQPDRDQQPPGPRPGRQDLVHPPDRLRDRQGARLGARH